MFVERMDKTDQVEVAASMSLLLQAVVSNTLTHPTRVEHQVLPRLVVRDSLCSWARRVREDMTIRVRHSSSVVLKGVAEGSMVLQDCCGCRGCFQRCRDWDHVSSSRDFVS